MSLICTVYKSLKKEGMYLYVEKSEDTARVPDSLLQMFGEPQMVMTLALTPERNLAQADRAEVERKIKEQGFFLQMPPGKEEYLLNLYTPGS